MSDRSETEAHQKMAQGKCKLKKRKEEEKYKGKETTLLETKNATPVHNTWMCFFCLQKPLVKTHQLPGQIWVKKLQVLKITGCVLLPSLAQLGASEPVSSRTEGPEDKCQLEDPPASSWGQGRL